MARRLSRDDIISNVYYNLETGFGSIHEDPFKKAKEQDQTINRVDVEKLYEENSPTNRLENTGVQTPTPHPSQGLNIKLT